MLGRSMSKPASQPSTDVQVAWLVHQRDQALRHINAALEAYASQPGSVSLPDVLLDIRNVLAPPRGARQ